MKKNIILLLLTVVMTTSAFGERTRLHMQTHQTGVSDQLTEEDRNPINIPIIVFYDSDTKILEVWCDNDNIQGEVYVYDEAGTLEVYSPYMNVCLTLTTSNYHSILMKGDGWEAEGYF